MARIPSQLVPIIAFTGALIAGSAHADPMNVHALAVDPVVPTTLYAGTDAGVRKSTDGGTTWIASGLSDTHIGTVAIDPHDQATLYAWPSYTTGFFKSTDGGATWRALNPSPSPSGPVSFDPSARDVLYAANLKSMDGGETWQAMNIYDGVASLTLDPNAPNVMYAGTWWSGIFKSIDSGSSWEPTGADWNQVSPTLAIAVDPLHSDTVYAGSGTQCCALDSTDRGGGGVFKSTDGGTTWLATGMVNSSEIFAFSAVHWLAADATSVYVVCDSLFYKSTDGGDTWKYIPILSDRYLAVQAMALDTSTPVTTLYAGTVLGVLKSVDGGESWRAAGMPDPTPPNGPLVLTLTSPTDDTVYTGAFNVSWTYTGGAEPITIRIEARSLSGFSTTPLGTAHPASTPGSFPLHARGMMQGRQLLVVTAGDASGMWSQVTREITVWYKDATPPDTSITSAVDSSGVSVASNGITLANGITFNVNGTDDTMVGRFECRLDAATFSPCTSPIAYSNLGIGRHDFEARAVDHAGNADATPARFTFIVDVAPDTSITSTVDGGGKPLTNGATRSDSITFRFSGTDNGTISRFECRLDAGSYIPCTSPRTYQPVTSGPHTFSVRAIDNNGFHDSSPATFTWHRR